MFRSAIGKLMWAGKATVFMMGLALMLALIFGMASAAFGANGGNFILGSLNNTATDITKLTGNVSGGSALQVVNPNTTTGSKGLQVNVQGGKPPIVVNPTAGKATNLNADKVDGRSFSCPSGTLFHEGVCIETTLRGTSSTFSTAQTDCLNEARTRLPTPAELQTLENRTSREWSNHAYQDFDTTTTTTQDLDIMVNADGTLTTATQSLNEAYRCVKQPR